MMMIKNEQATNFDNQMMMKGGDPTQNQQNFDGRS